MLRYLPTHLTAPEIADQLSVSTTTVKTHLRNVYMPRERVPVRNEPS